MSTPAPNPRASLLAGLRTGGVRSASGGAHISNIPHTAAPGGSFNVPRFASQHYSAAVYPEEEEDELPEMPSQNVFAHSLRQAPQTAAVDGPNNRFAQQQRGMNPNSVPFNPSFSIQHAQQQQQQQQQQVQQQQQQAAQTQAAQATQALQMQMMQLEIMRLQTIQAQQYQAELLAQAQRQQVQNRRASLQLQPPASAGPLHTGFDLRAATAQAQMRRASHHAELLKAQLNGSDDQVPMTAALGGKFGSRTTSLGTSTLARYSDDSSDDGGSFNPPPTPGATTVISGGTSLGHASGATAAISVAPAAAPSRSDTAVSWRRGGNSNSVLSGNNRSLSVKITPPPSEQRVSPPPASASSNKARPLPLRFTSPAPPPALVVDSATDSATDNDDTYSTSSSKSGGGSGGSSPTTPRSASSGEMVPLSPREEAAKKLYEGLGIGRPLPAPAAVPAPPAMTMASYRMVSQPMRQPRGPPSGSDELGPMNFATRIRRKAIGGLGMLMGARERREIVDVY